MHQDDATSFQFPAIPVPASNPQPLPVPASNPQPLPVPASNTQPLPVPAFNTQPFPVQASKLYQPLPVPASNPQPLLEDDTYSITETWEMCSSAMNAVRPSSPSLHSLPGVPKPSFELPGKTLNYDL